MSPYYRILRRAVGAGLLLVPSVAAVIHDADGRLLLQRKADDGWSLPAGAIEPGEAPDQALEREVREETGLTVQSARVIGVYGGPAFRHTYPNGDRVEYAVVLYRCTVQAHGEPIDSETTALRYVARRDLPDLALPYPVEVLFQEGS